MPELNNFLLRRKYADLKSGSDNLKYIERTVQAKQKHAKLLANLRKKYNYRRKRVVFPGQHADKEAQALRDAGKKVLMGFKSHFQRQVDQRQPKVSKFEVLRAHILNYQMLSPKEKRTVLGFVNARRSRDARKLFREELSLLAQKIAFDQKQRMQREDPVAQAN